MTTRLAITGRPPWAVTAWMDDNAVYIELPVTDGPPYITKYALSDSGLSKALGAMRDIYRKMAPTGGAVMSLPPHPKTKYDPKGEFTLDQRETARALLKRMKIT